MTPLERARLIAPEVHLPFTLEEPLVTERLVVRPMTLADVDDVHAYQSREDVCRYVPHEPRTRASVVDKLGTDAKALTLGGDGDSWRLAIERVQWPGRVIGDVYFMIVSTADAAGEIGWAVHPDFAGRGYMTEAASAAERRTA